jgi:hypothetical protein
MSSKARTFMRALMPATTATRKRQDDQPSSGAGYYQLLIDGESGSVLGRAGIGDGTTA